MIVRPCPTHISGCPCIDDNPFANLSSEAPDPPDVIRMGYAAADPPINSPDNFWDVPFALGSCAGTDAQDTQDCADGQAEREGDANQQTFRSAQRTCTVPCPDGSSFSYTLKAGAVTSPTQALADYLASTVCLYRAQQARQCGPTAVTSAATNIADTSATLNGTVNPNGISTSVFFQWGTDTTYGNITPVTNIGSGNVTLPFFANISGLTPGMTYHFRIVAVNSKGTNMGADVMFQTTSTLSPVAWWDFEEAAGNFFDIIRGLALIPGGINGTVTHHAVGKIDFGAGFSGASIGLPQIDVFENSNFVAMPYAITGSDITFWWKVTTLINMDIILISLEFDLFNAIAVTYDSIAVQLSLSDTFGNTLSIPYNPIDGLYHMYRVFFDPANATMGFQIDNGAIHSIATPMNPPASPTSRISFFCNTHNVLNPSNLNVFWDELAVWPQVLTSAELDVIWNNGNGTTWPIP